MKTSGSSLLEEAEKVAGKYPRVKPVLIDVTERPDHVRSLVESSDIVVSLLPFQLHHLVAESCIEAKVNMVTA